MGNGGFLTPKPSFPGFGDFDPCTGLARAQVKILYQYLTCTILFKIITRIIFWFESFRDYSYSCQGSFELICITVTVSLHFLQNAVTGNHHRLDFLKSFLLFQLHDLIVCESDSDLRWAKSRDSYHRIASESYRCDSNR